MIFQYISIWSVCNYIVKYCDMFATPLSIYFMLVDLRDLPLQVLMGSLRRNLSWYSWWNRSRSLVLTRPALRKSSRCSRLWRLLKLQQLTPVPAVQGWKRYFALQDPHFTAISEGFLWFSILTTSCFVFFFLPVCYTSSTAQGGGGSFKNRKPIGEVGCCESGMAERSHWLTERWLELCLLEWLQWLQWSPHPQLLDVVWCTATVVVVVA